MHEFYSASTRRQFLTIAALGTVTIIACPELSAQEKLVDINDPMVKALKYVHSHEGVDRDLQRERMGVPFSNQFCSNCIHYKQTTKINGEPVGTCAVLPGKGLVKDRGWCNVWAKK